MYTIGSQRHLFDIPDGVAYFNTASSSPQLNAARDRLLKGARAKSHPWERQPSDYFSDADRIRLLAAGLFGGGDDCWAVIPSASYGISAAARAIEARLKPGDRVVVMGDEFPSNMLPWRRMASEVGAVLTSVPPPADGDRTAAMLAAVRSDVRVVAIPHCHWTNGALLDLDRISAACRDIGAFLVLDVTQSLGALRLDLGTIDPDFMVAAGYKWLMCPYGFGLMYVAPRWHAARPLEESWLARADAHQIATVMSFSDAYRPGARRFDVGETCVATILPGAIAALEQLQAWGIPRTAESLAAISARIVSTIEELGFGVAPSRCRAPHMFGATLPTGCSDDIAVTLSRHGVFVSRRADSIRFAPHLHVTEADMVQLAAALRRILS